MNGSNPDPVASLRISAINVEVAGRTFTIPPLPAVDWLEILLDPSPDLMDIFPGLSGREAVDAVNEAYWTGELDAKVLEVILQDVLTAASGRPWWFTIKLCESMRLAWRNLGGELVTRGVDAERISLAAWVEAAYLTLRKNLRVDTPESKALSEQFLEDLNNPPVPEELDEEADSDAFMTAMNSAWPG